MTPKESLIASDITAEGMLADSVVAAEGKLFIQGGGWNVVQSPVMPTRHARIGIALLLRVPYAMADNMPHKFSLTLQDEDGHPVPLGDAPAGVPSPDGKLRAIEGGFTIGRPALIQPGDEQALPIAVNIDGLLFEKAGGYVFHFSVDGREVKALHFRISHMGLPGMALPR